ncbi:hypothetical protein NDU88_006251 [Pleurodeles waltl]|uniref:Uncharacterized protein n=1 Tax=Pleurodeles waltl TaxID=8319 RepID=A0AAV7WX33_PLEWA|nr:hypothetical protein NDU88_006251 [Pleurodeles waltl]
MGRSQRIKDDASAGAPEEGIKQGTRGSEALQLDDKLDKLLAVINATRERLGSKIDSIVVELGLICEDAKKNVGAGAHPEGLRANPDA